MKQCSEQMSEDTTLCEFWTKCEENMPPAPDSATLDEIRCLEICQMQCKNWGCLPEHPPIPKKEAQELTSKKRDLAIRREATAAKRKATLAAKKKAEELATEAQKKAEEQEEVSLLCDESMLSIVGVEWTNTESFK